MFTKKRDNGIVQIREGVWRQNLAWGERTHLVKFFLDKGSTIPVHSHNEEQTGYLISGRMIFNIDGAEYSVDAGDSWSIEGGTPHGVKVLEDCLVIETFSPPRKDYLGCSCEE